MSLVFKSENVQITMFTFSKKVCSSHHVLEHRFISKTTETLIESLGIPDKGGLICNAIFNVEIKSRNKNVLGLSHTTLNKYTTSEYFILSNDRK